MILNGTVCPELSSQLSLPFMLGWSVEHGNWWIIVESEKLDFLCLSKAECCDAVAVAGLLQSVRGNARLVPSAAVPLWHVQVQTGHAMLSSLSQASSSDLSTR